MPLFLILLFTLLLFPQREVFASTEVSVNEVNWMGTVPVDNESAQAAANNEWIELKNNTSSPVDLLGWRLEWRGGEYGITFGSDKCPNTTIAAGAYFLLERTNDDTVPGVAADCVYTGALSNSGERLVLKNTAGGVVAELDASTGWPAGDNATKETMQQKNGGWVTATATPRAQNFPLESNSSPTPASPSQTSSAPSSGPLTSFPSIKVHAGDDRNAVVGSELLFSGSALGLLDKPLEGARFLWNFGDGTTHEGKVAYHAFPIPGAYTVGLHVSSGSYAASDYLSVRVLPNQVKVGGVIEGKGGHISLINQGEIEVDIGNWVIEERGKLFIIPQFTKIGPRSEVALANSITGLFLEAGDTTLFVRYPNGSLALEWKKEKQLAAPTVVAAISGAMSFQKPAEDTAVDSPENTVESASHIPAPAPEKKEKPKNYIFFVSAFLVSAASALGFMIIKNLFR